MSAAAAVGGALGIGGSAVSAHLAAREAKKNRKFQKKMYKHRYQYQVKDMKKAGLNPALAYGQSPGGAPGGATASMPDIGSAATSGMQAGTAMSMAKSQKALLAEQRTVAETQGTLNTAQAGLADAKAGMLQPGKHLGSFLGDVAEEAADWMTESNSAYSYGGFKKTMESIARMGPKAGQTAIQTLVADGKASWKQISQWFKDHPAAYENWYRPDTYSPPKGARNQPRRTHNVEKSDSRNRNRPR